VKARVDPDTGLLAAAFAHPYHPEASEALSTVPVIRLATSC
jgi:RPA family protein